MCRSIHVLRTAGDPAGEDEIHAAALQFVRKISGMRHPSSRNAEAFERAVADVTATSRRLLQELPPKRSVPPREPVAEEAPAA
jgi:hypothetical protein